MKEFKVIKRLTGKNQGVIKNNCIELDISKPYEYVKPIVMCFTGNSGNKMEFANGFAKAIENTAKIEDEVELISIKYREKYSVGVFEQQDVERFVDCFFVPLLQKNGNKLSIEQVKRNLRKITIVTHCYGAEFVKYINNVLQDRMLKLGYKEDKVISILNSIIHIGYAPYTQSNYNTNFYFKSVNDKTFVGKRFDLLGEEFEDEVTTVIQNLPPKERKRYYIKDKLYLGNGIIENNGNFNFYGENLTGTVINRNDDHRAGIVLKDNKGNFLVDDENLHAHTMAKCFSLILKRVIENSIQNETAQVSLDFKEIEKECAEYISKANASETEMIKRKVFENSIEHITLQEAMKRMPVTEKDFLEGKVNIDTIIKSVVGIVDFDNDSIYAKTKWAYCNPSVGFRVCNKENIHTTEIMPHKEGIILFDGSLAVVNELQNLEEINLALLVNKKRLEGSIKYRIMKRNGKTCIALSDNYGSRERIIENDFESQIKFWKKEYKEDLLTMQLTEQQKTAIKNLCLYFEIDEKNIRFKKEDGLKI